MRFFPSKVLSAAGWIAPVLAIALPSTHNGTTIQNEEVPRGPVLELDLHQNYAQAIFNVPCPGCLGKQNTDHDDDSLTLNFKTHSLDQACGTSNITLNGVSLPQEWNGDLATGSGSFTGLTDVDHNAWSTQHSLDIEWESACLNANISKETGVTTSNAASQVLTVTIKGIDGKPLDKPSGFTISYNQLSPPQLVRLERTPNHLAKYRGNADSWAKPPSHLRILIPSSSDNHLASTEENEIEKLIRELRALQEEAAELDKAIKEKQKHIHSQLRKEGSDLKKELKDCKNITCVLKTVAHKAHGAWRIVYIRFRPSHHPPSSNHDMGRPDDYARLDHHNTQAPGANIHTESIPSPLDATSGHDYSLPPPPPPKHPLVFTLEVVVGILCCGCLVTLIRHRCSSLRTRTDRAATREERRNERAYRHAARRLAWSNWWRRTTWRDQDRIADYEEKRALINSQESLLEAAMQQEIRQLRTAHNLVNDLVSQAEQGRLPRTYPHTLPPLHHPQPPQQPPPPQTCTCQHTQRQQPPTYPIASTPYSPTSSTYSHSSLAHPPSRPISRSSSLPGYASDSDTTTEPPAYESDEDTSDLVANGFRYVPTSAGLDSSSPSVEGSGRVRSSSNSSLSEPWTPDSSIIDVSPRPSADTLRYVEFAEREGDARRSVSSAERF